MTVDTYPLPTTEAPTRTMPDWFDFKTEHPDMKPPRRNDPRKARERKRTPDQEIDVAIEPRR